MPHARLGPSNHRWPHCPGSVKAEEPYPDIPGEAAIDGTGSHLLLELCLEHNVMPVQYEGQIVGVNHEDNLGGWIVHRDRCDRVDMCLAYLKRRYEELTAQYPDCEIMIESESHSDPGGMFGRDDWNGTVDITITVLDGDICRFIEVCDYKDGRGWVAEKNNSQLIAYLAGKLRKYIASGPQLVRPFNTHAVRSCRVSIVQPKTNPPIRYQDMTATECMDQTIELAHAAHLTDDPNAPRIAGKHCQWCKDNPKRGGTCTANADKSIEVIKHMTNEIAPEGAGLFEMVQRAVVDLKVIDNDRLGELADARDGIVAMFDQINTEIQERIEAGQKVSGYAMLPGNSTKAWDSDEEEIVKLLKGKRVKKELIYPAKLITPAAALKLDCLSDKQREAVNARISKIAGSSKLTKVSKEQEETSAELMFGDVVPETPVSFF